jgi:hypothetical protein
MMSREVVALIVGVGALAFLVVWLIAGRLRSGSEATRTGPALQAPVFAPASPDVQEARPAADEDPLVAESKRYIERESRHAGLDVPTAEDGRVHLRGGGSITPEQFRDARRRAESSPVMHPPLPPPPMP